jgi:hypothetical protein
MNEESSKAVKTHTKVKAKSRDMHTQSCLLKCTGLTDAKLAHLG